MYLTILQKIVSLEIKYQIILPISLKIIHVETFEILKLHLI